MAELRLHLDRMVDVLKAVAEPSRLRILALLSRGDLTVSDLTTILGQSQPRVSRHLKLLGEADLIDRYQEGAWAFFRLSDNALCGEVARDLLARLNVNDPLIERDMERLSQVKASRQEKAAAYFSANAGSWDEIRKLHVSESAVEAALRKIVGERPFQAMLDVGTGTGRLLELFSPLYNRGLGIDINRDMLAVARANLDLASVGNAQVRQGDVYALPVERENFDLVTIHQVLHFLDDPQAAIREATRALRPDGRLLIVDFAPHRLEFLREEHAHLRLGFSDEQMLGWMRDAGLEPEKTTELSPRTANGDEGLTVKLWLARDPRLLIADPVARNESMTETV
ncbi:ArsR family transcriptional regulator [Falsochrobactrum shanghaiense]|uniref:ArsR family transcriptional regulator n=1 Tax=Falsochrobactrum shanghaiense TaxID=2201899 RepID=A0A316J5X9_9HYPH|nr:metalloregulator ArsR/SmtB family transcription factor [Falsochrobactrum shanghaiense]PWL17267.1 ArsR family transcriptional regulator [Falsochrobactrum shanghaiense]